MVQKQKEIEHIELFFATTGALGANVSGLRDAIKEQLSQFSWQIKDKKESIKIELIHIVKLMQEFINERANLAVGQKDKNNLISMVKELRSICKSAKKKYLSIVVHQDIGDVLRRIC